MPATQLGANLERAAYTINEFCAAHRISRSQYYEMKRRGTGPREMDAEGKILISVEASADWRRACEAAASGPQAAA